jgi:hypothetical protein
MGLYGAAMTIHELAALIRKERDTWAFGEDDSQVVVTLHLESSRQHKVRLTHFRHENAEYVRFQASIGPAGSMEIARASSALALNSHLAFGAVAIHNNELVLTETQPLGTVTPQLATVIISYLAHQADRYEAVMFHTDEK